MLYGVIWIAVVDISLLNLDSDRKLWHVRDLVVLFRGVTLLRGGVMVFFLILGTTSMLYSVIWIDVVDIPLLNLDSNRKLWHVRELVVLFRGPHD